MSTNHQSAVSAETGVLRQQFKDALRSNQRPEIESYLARAGLDAERLLGELSALELDHRLRTGEEASAAEYLKRFPQLLQSPVLAIKLAGIEFLGVQSRLPHMTKDAFGGRYPELAKLPEWGAAQWPVSAPDDTRLSRDDPETIADGRGAGDSSTDFLKTILSAPVDPTVIGSLGDYEIRGILGTGGMGVVLRAEDTKLRRTVAIKLMRPEVASMPGAKERFLREARAAAAVEHPRVVIIHHVGEFNGIPFVVMPLMSGRSLGSHLRAGSPISLPDVVRYVREAAEGLAAAHAKQLIHRDVKPDNIWIEQTAEGTHVRLLDFGLVRVESPEHLPQTVGVVGTPQYMAPEQAQGQQVDGRSDLFSLGCVLYELLARKRPFRGDTLYAVLNALVNHHPPPPRVLNPSVPESLTDLTMRLLEKSPARRPATAADVAAELRRMEARFEEQKGEVTVELPKPILKSKVRTNAWRGALAIGVVLIVALLVLPLLRDPNSQTASQKPAGSIPAPVASDSPLHVTQINVHHIERTSGGDVLIGILGDKSYRPRLGDLVTIDARLSRPGYAYLIAFRPDGVGDICFPADENTSPPFMETPRYPLSDGPQAYELAEGTGLWVFTVVASEKPLPAYSQWKTRPDWSPLSSSPPGVVWRDNGSGRIESLTERSMSTVRGKDVTLEGPLSTIKQLTDSLRVDDGVTVSAIGFCVSHRE